MLTNFYHSSLFWKIQYFSIFLNPLPAQTKTEMTPNYVMIFWISHLLFCPNPLFFIVAPIILCQMTHTGELEMFGRSLINKREKSSLPTPLHCSQWHSVREEQTRGLQSCFETREVVVLIVCVVTWCDILWLHSIIWGLTSSHDTQSPSPVSSSLTSSNSPM